MEPPFSSTLLTFPDPRVGHLRINPVRPSVRSHKGLQLTPLNNFSLSLFPLSGQGKGPKVTTNVVYCSSYSVYWRALWGRGHLLPKRERERERETGTAVYRCSIVRWTMTLPPLSLGSTTREKIIKGLLLLPKKKKKKRRMEGNFTVGTKDARTGEGETY